MTGAIAATMTVAIAAAFFLATALTAADQGTTVVRGGNIVTVGRRTIENGTVIIRDGRIAAVGRDLAIPAGARIIDATGCWMLPGFIDAFTDLGLCDPAVSESDRDETSSPMTPQVRTFDGFDPANKYLGLARACGMTTALVAPGTANVVAGQSMLVRLTGNDVAKMAVRASAAMHVSLGEGPKAQFGNKGQAPTTRMGAASMLRQMLLDAGEYRLKLERYESKPTDEAKAEKDKSAKPEKSAPPARDLVKESLVQVLKGDIPLVVKADRLDDIMTAVRIAEEFGLRLVINGGAEAYKAKELLAAKKIPVILRPRSAAGLTNETSGSIYENAALLSAAGVTIAFQTGGTRDLGDLLPQAREAVAHGLSGAVALEALTIAPARIFGADKELGTIEAGKAADLLIFEGDPLTTAARLRMSIIGGETAYEKAK